MSQPVTTLQDRADWRAALVFPAVVFGLAFTYSLAGTAIGRTLFPDQANGSLLRDGDRVIGSALVAQPFVSDGYFTARPSAASYDPMGAAGSNQARSNPALRERIDAAIASVAERERIDPAQVPADLVTQSGGGFDPHLSPAAVRVQIARVAKARGMPEGEVLALVEQSVELPQFGILGAARVNVLKLNLLLDAPR